jgi:hypothetical protein
LSSANLVVSAAPTIDPFVENALIQVCKSVQLNKVYKVNASLREFNLNVDIINEMRVCNDQSVRDFTISNGADGTARITTTR